MIQWRTDLILPQHVSYLIQWTLFPRTQIPSRKVLCVCVCVHVHVCVMLAYIFQSLVLCYIHIRL